MADPFPAADSANLNSSVNRSDLNKMTEAAIGRNTCHPRDCKAGHELSALSIDSSVVMFMMQSWRGVRRKVVEPRSSYYA